ncbi:hypothetical protein ILUMI_13820 [Ignelater luminosus]|uniref:PiggyBac transposable element-derived protein 3 n=1 Tax=Ignelater luminosus TaxID=2038154 RepID=A0A8K0CTP7_IGNLU|nr:hypothetical protein ILUMI_13820 [Ignelater luminosus]
MRFEGTSTVRDNRTEQCPLEDRKAFGKKARGWYDFALDEENNVIVVRWNDNSVVTVISNKCGVAPLEKAKRYFVENRNKIDIVQPNLIHV